MNTGESLALVGGCTIGFLCGVATTLWVMAKQQRKYWENKRGK